MSKQGTIIVVDDNKGVLSAVKLLLKNHPGDRQHPAEQADAE